MTEKLEKIKGEKIFKSQEIPGLNVKVEKSDGEKCERCWVYSYDIGKDKNNPKICGRCSDAL